MKNSVELNLRYDIVGLAGYEYGLQIYESQVRGKINLSEPFYIKFPSNIRFAASSFVQGFFSKIIEEIGLSFTLERAKIVSENENIQSKFLSKLI